MSDDVLMPPDQDSQASITVLKIENLELRNFKEEEAIEVTINSFKDSQTGKTVIFSVSDETGKISLDIRKENNMDKITKLMTLSGARVRFQKLWNTQDYKNFKRISAGNKFTFQKIEDAPTTPTPISTTPQPTYNGFEKGAKLSILLDGYEEPNEVTYEGLTNFGPYTPTFIKVKSKNGKVLHMRISSIVQITEE